MLLVSTIKTKIRIGILLLLGSATVSAQENSPFSRYGLGDLVPTQHVINRGMAGISSPYIDAQSINFSNPASYSGLKVVTFDVGVTIDNRTLKSANPTGKFSSVNFLPSYIAMGLPINKKQNIGLVFGLKPVSRINYSIQEFKRLPGIDSSVALYEGNGGFNQLFIGLGKRWGKLNLGINTGYSFGRKETSTKIFIFNTDTSSFIPFSNSNTGTITTYGQFFLNGGLQYDAVINPNITLRFGASATLKQSLKAKQDLLRETFQFDASGNALRLDSVFQVTEKAGTIKLPATYTAGVALQKTLTDRLGNKVDKATLAIEYESAQWSKYSFYGQPDKLINSWKFRVGGQFVPNPLSINSYWNRVTYRAGVNFGKDHINADGKELSLLGVTIGAGLPVRKWRSFDNQFTVINTAIEFGKRGNSNNNITENYFRIAFGVSLSDIWFIKRKYD